MVNTTASVAVVNIVCIDVVGCVVVSGVKAGDGVSVVVMDTGICVAETGLLTCGGIDCVGVGVDTVPTYPAVCVTIGSDPVWDVLSNVVESELWSNADVGGVSDLVDRDDGASVSVTDRVAVVSVALCMYPGLILAGVVDAAVMDAAIWVDLRLSETFS